MTKNPRRRRITAPTPVGIRDVARLAGVSVASVSRVLNTPEVVGDQLTQRIQAAIKQLNYIPNSAARALITRRTRIIGAIIPTIAYSIYSAFIEALQKRLNAANYNLVIAIAGYERKGEYEQALQLIMSGAEALMLSGEIRDQRLYQLLQARDIPYVLSSIFHPNSPHPCVGYDNKEAASRTANHLLDLGHRHIATITGNCAKIDRFAERVEGIRDSLKKRSLKLREEWIVERNVTIAEARDASRQIMSAQPRPSAIICGNDVLAFGAVLEAQAMGLRVPDEISITGFDDMEWSAQISPSLTTIQIPLAEMGTRVGDYLLGRLQGEPVPHASKIEVNLVLRESTGPYRS